MRDKKSRTGRALAESGISAEVNGICVHSLRATAATNALSHEADIANRNGSAMRMPSALQVRKTSYRNAELISSCRCSVSPRLDAVSPARS
jgi:hypothetical protein